jgi:MOSC domain-containing protein YiiM
MIDIEITALVTSPGHSYWFHSKDPADGVGPHPTLTHDAVELVAGKGIVGDRFYGKVSALNSAVSFVAAEAVEEVAAELGLARDALDPVLMRRNIVTRGVDLNALRRERFTIRQGDVLEFEAGGETSPCAWMDWALAPGARDLLRGRGGLRATPVTSGTLRVGPAVLETTVPMAAERAGQRVRRGRLP